MDAENNREDSSLEAFVSGPERRSVSRRRVLSFGAGAAFLGAGLVGGAVSLRPSAPDAPQRRVRDHRVPLPAGKPPMVIARGRDAAMNVRAALDAMGGIAAFVKKGEVVLVKPNIGWERTPAQAGNTDPGVVAELVRLCLRAGASAVLVSDVSCHDGKRSYAKSGIEAAARAAGARVILPSAAPRSGVQGPDTLGRWEVPEPFVIADKIINVPIAKHHGLTKLTAGMKNWLGALHGKRNALHARIDEALIELEALFRPTLTVIDATRVLMANGPTGGNLADVKRLNALAVSIDPVAADAWAAEAIEKKPTEIGYIVKAQQRGLGKRDYKALGAREITVG